ncbi:O-antigen ligase family protein [Clostridium gasigenes]|uniref:O-antigen ligase family protein n=1 Tax=Clostridium gasigenes TaxID=94869 RepID=UPI0014384325|nr:O-antigen ligase family protein [Clostridium gasigenes]NKF06663.1 hypothetical protein [Clostridium gasigenes]QSW20987.1 O-antigen ligase family protein [Clostridium gasigenes]
MVFKIIIAILPLVIPYTYFGENLSALILASVAIVFLWKNKEGVEVNKRYFQLLCSIGIIAIVTQIIISPYLESFSGIFNYINMILYYLALSIILNQKEKNYILKYMIRTLGVLAIYFIIVQGLYFNVRIYGNIGYANSYGLLLLIGIYLNRIREAEKLTEILEIIFIMGILFTGSRTTIILLLFYVGIRIKQSLIVSKEKVIDCIGPVIWGFIQYIIYTNMGLLSILVAPIVIYIYSVVRKSKRRDWVYGFGLIVSVIILFVNNSNTLERIRNISVNNGSVQERLVFFEDSLSAIIKNPLGNGINMFQYKLYDNASAFYDVKYIHNSILQTSYDIGVIGGILFLLIFIYGFFILYKSDNRNRMFLLSAYISIFLHSLMDFDFSYSTFGILWVMIILLGSKGEKINLHNYIKKIYSVLLIIVIYLGMFEGTLVIGGNFTVNNNIEMANRFYNIGERISLERDYRASFKKAEGYKLLYDKNGNENSLKDSLEELKNSQDINLYDPRILWNMAYIHEKLGDTNKSMDIRNELLEIERFYPEAYIVQHDYLIKLYAETKNEKYIEMIEALEDYYYKNVKELNPKAKYMKNQLKESYDDIRRKGEDYTINISGEYEGEYIYYDQEDSRWSNISYKSENSFIGNSGCGIVSMAIVQSTMRKKEITPIELAEYSMKNGYCNNNTTREFFTDITKDHKYSLKVSKFDSSDLSKVKRVLSDGKHMAVAIMKPGHFTREGHYIVLYGVETINGDNYFNILDCNKNNKNYMDDGTVIYNNPKDGTLKAKTSIFTQECDEYWVYSLE